MYALKQQLNLFLSMQIIYIIEVQTDGRKFQEVLSVQTASIILLLF